MEHLLPFAHVQGQGTLGTGGLLAQGNDLAGMPVATRGDFIGNVMHFEQRRLGLGLGNEGADTLHAHQQAFGRQFAQGAVDGHAAEAQLIDQLAFRRHTVVWRPAAVLDLLGDHLFDAGVQGRRTIAHLGNQRSNGRRSRHGNSFDRKLIE
ncbi:hypothetical protein D3C84_761770 [compost metagenome]